MGKSPCCDKRGLKKGPWTAEEDKKLMDYIHKHGHGRWRTIPKNAGIYACLIIILLTLSVISTLIKKVFNFFIGKENFSIITIKYIMDIVRTEMHIHGCSYVELNT